MRQDSVPIEATLESTEPTIRIYEYDLDRETSSFQRELQDLADDIGAFLDDQGNISISSVSIRSLRRKARRLKIQYWFSKVLQAHFQDPHLITTERTRLVGRDREVGDLMLRCLNVAALSSRRRRWPRFPVNRSLYRMIICVKLNKLLHFAPEVCSMAGRPT